MSGIRINEIPRDSALNGNVDLVHVYKLVGGQFKSVAAPLSAVAFEGPRGTDGQDGANGIDGGPGGSFAQLVCYRRFNPNDTAQQIADTRPGLNTNDDGSFDFGNRIFTEPTGWYRTPPAVTPSTSDWILYQTTGVAFVEGVTGTDNSIEWSDPDIAGIDGRVGTDGKSTYQALVYTRSATNPGRPYGGQFDFGSDTLLPPLSGDNVSNGGVIPDVQNPNNDNTHNWYIDVGGAVGPPETDDPVWVCRYQFAAPGDTGSDDATQWGLPTKFTGTDGADGYSTYFGIIYKRTNTDISNDRPGNGDGTAANNGYYDFRANQFVFSPALTGSGGFLEGWSEIPPPDTKVNGQTTALWSSTTVATARSNFLGTDPVIDDTLTWTMPVTAVQPVVDGNRGDAITQVRAYIRSYGGVPSVTTLANASVLFNFESKILDLGTSGWSNRPYASTLVEGETGYGSDTLYVSVGVARSTFDQNSGTYPNDIDIEWSTPVPSSEEGRDSISTYLAQCYTRYSGTVPLSDFPPTGGSYSFTNNLLTTPTDPSNGPGVTWYVNIPPGTGEIYVTQQQFAILGNTGSRDGGNNWSPPANLAYDGTAGFNGATNAGISLYYGSDTELLGANIPDFPNDVTVSVDLDPTSNAFGTVTKSTTNGQDANLTNNQILSSNSAGLTVGTGWYTRIPTNDWIYITQAIAADSDRSDNNFVDTIAGNEWSETVTFRKPGSDGLTGLGTAIVSLYKRTNSASIPDPAKPSGPVRFYLGSGDGRVRGDIIAEPGSATTFNSWTKDPPSFTGNNDHYLWQINATASSRLCADKIFANEWSTPNIFSQNPFDLTETTVSHNVQVYQRSSTAPTAEPGTVGVFLSGENAGQIHGTLQGGWSRIIEPGTAQIWISHATASGPVSSVTSQDQIFSNEWTPAAEWGIKGDKGDIGPPGDVAQIVSLYKRTSRPPADTVEEPEHPGVYDFASGAFTFTSGSETWTTLAQLPAKDATDKFIWQTNAIAISSVTSDTYTIAADKWSEPKAITEDGTTLTPVFSTNFANVSASFNSTYLDDNDEEQDHTHINFSDEYIDIDENELLTRASGGTIAASTLTFTKIVGADGATGLAGSSSITIFSDVENPQIGTDNLSYTQTTGSGENLIVRNFVVYINVGPSETYESRNDLDLTDSNNQTFIDSLNFGNIKGQPGVSVSSITRAANGLVTIDYDDDNKPDDTFTIVDGADVSVTGVSRNPTTGVVTMSFSNGGDQTFDLADGVGIGSVTALKSGSTTTVRIENDNGTLLREFDIEDGLPGVKGRVLVVYAEDADGTNPSTTIGSREFVKYHEYEGDTAPNISDFAANTGTLSGGFVQFIGPQGITNSIFPIYADDAEGTNATVDASSNKPFVTFVESSTPITNSNIPSGQTYVKYLGSDGTSVTIQGSKDNQSQLNALISSATTGDSYIGTGNGDLDEGNLYVFDGTSFNNVGTIQGPTGNAGKNATPVYATSTNGANASLTPAAGKTFIAFVNFTNANPQDSDIPGGLTFTNFKGKGISSVEKTGTTVTVNYDDGSDPDTFTVNDGADVSVTDVSRNPTTGVVTMSFSNGGDQTFDLADGVGIKSVNAVPNAGGTGTTVTIKDDNDTVLATFDIADGLPGVKGRVLVVYADDASGTNPSTTIGTRTFVKYFEYEGDDTPSATTAASGGGFVQFIGPEGPIGAKITPLYSTASIGANVSLSNAPINSPVGQIPRTFVNFFEGDVDQIDGTNLKFNGQNVGTINGMLFVNMKGDKGDKGDLGPPGAIPIFASDANGNGATLTQTSSTPYIFFYTGGAVDPLTPTDDLKALGSANAWTKIAGDSLYIHVKYADRVLTSSDDASDMTDDPTGKKYIGLLYNQVSPNESPFPGEYTWSLLQAPAVVPNGYEAIPFYSNNDPRTIVFDQENSELILSEHTNSSDINIGMVYPAINCDGFRSSGKTISGIVRFKVSSSIGDTLPGPSTYFRAYEYDQELPAGKIAVGYPNDPNSSADVADIRVQQGRQVFRTYAGWNDTDRPNKGYFKESGKGSSSSFLEAYKPEEDIGYTTGNGTGSGTLTATEFVSIPFEYVPSPNAKYVSFGMLNWDNVIVLGKRDVDDEDGDGNTLDQIAYSRSYVADINATITPNTLVSSGLNGAGNYANIRDTVGTSSIYDDRVAKGNNFFEGDYIRTYRDGVDVFGNYKRYVDYYGYTGTDNTETTSLANGDWELRETTDKNLHVKSLTFNINGDKGDKGTNAITNRLVEIYYKQSLTSPPPSVTRQLLVANTDSIVAANPVQSNSSGSVWRTIDTDASSFTGTSGIKLWHRTYPATTGGVPDSTIENSGWSYDETTSIIKITATRAGGTGGFGSYFRIANLKPYTKYNLSGEFRVVEDTLHVTNTNTYAAAMVDMSEGDFDDTTADGTALFRQQTASTTFVPFDLKGTITPTNLTAEGLNINSGSNHFIDLNMISQGSGASNGTMTGEFKNLLLEEVTNEKFIFNNYTINASNPTPQFGSTSTDLLYSQGTLNPQGNPLRIWSKGFGQGTVTHSYSYDINTDILTLEASRVDNEAATGRFGSYFRIRNLRPGTKYRMTGEFRIRTDDTDTQNATAVIDFSDRSITPPADGSGLGGAVTDSSNFQAIDITITADHGVLSDIPEHYFVDINIFSGTNDSTGTIIGDFKNLLLEEINDIDENTVYDISTGELANVPLGWSSVAPNAESGKKIYRATAAVSYDSDLETDTDATVLIPDLGQHSWTEPRAWNDGGNRTAPVVSRIANYEYLDSSYLSVDNTAEPISSFYSFRKKSVSSVEDDNDGDSQDDGTFGDVNNGYGTAIATSIESIDSIGQVLFNKKGKGGIDNTAFWRDLNSASEFIWKYQQSWILFQRISVVDLGGRWTGVKVNVLDHSDDLQFIKDLPGHYKPYETSNGTPDTTKAAEAVFGYNPSILQETVFLYRRTASSTLLNSLLTPTGTIEYNFNTKGVTGSLNGWSLDAPESDGVNAYLWRIQAKATADLKLGTNEYVDDIPDDEWSPAIIFAQDGTTGPAGNTYFTKFLYTRTSTGEPGLKTGWADTDYKPQSMNIVVTPSGDNTIGRVVAADLASNVLVSSGTGEKAVTWYEDIPDESLGQHLWVIVAPVAAVGSADPAESVTIGQNQWAEPVKLAKNGVGLNSATVRLYRRTTGSTPSGGGAAGVNALGFSYSGSGQPDFKYNFETGALNLMGVTMNGWSQSTEAGSGGTLWVSRAVASAAGTSDDIGWGQWSVPEKLVTDGVGLVLIDENFFGNTAEAARQDYKDFIDANYSGQPPVNSYHFETVSGQPRKSWLYIGPANDTTGKDDVNNFRQLTIDGADGQQGTSFEFQGVVDSILDISNPSHPDYNPDLKVGDVYRVTGNSFNDSGDPRTSNISAVLVRQEGGWSLLTSDGDDGEDGLPGDDANVYITYNSNSVTSNPGTPPAGNGNTTTGTIWTTAASSEANWMSIKIAKVNDASTSWEPAIQISGARGEPGTSTINIKIFKRWDGFPQIPTGGAYDFENKRLLVPTTGANPYGSGDQYTWSSTSQNAGKAPDGTAAPTERPEDKIGYEWTLSSGSNNVEDSSTWDITGIDHSASESLPLWSSTTTFSVGATSPDQIDSSPTWSRPVLEKLNGYDFDDDSIDSDAIFGVVEGSGVLKIIAQDRNGTPLTAAAYEALSEGTDALVREGYGWELTDTIDEQTLYIIR